MCQVLKTFLKFFFPSCLYFVLSFSFYSSFFLAQNTNGGLKFPRPTLWISAFPTVSFLSHIHFVTVIRMKFHLQFLSPMIAASPPIFLDSFFN